MPCLFMCLSTCEAIICLRTLQGMQVREIGLQFAADDWSPFLKFGVTWALHQSAESLSKNNKNKALIKAETN